MNTRNLQLLMLCIGAFTAISCGNSSDKISFPAVFKGTYTVTARRWMTQNTFGGFSWDCKRTSSTDEVTLTLDANGAVKFEAPIDHLVNNGVLSHYDTGGGIGCGNITNPSLFSSDRDTFTGSHDSAASFSFQNTLWAECDLDIVTRKGQTKQFEVNGSFKNSSAQFSGNSECNIQLVQDNFAPDTVLFQHAVSVDVSFTGTIAK